MKKIMALLLVLVMLLGLVACGGNNKPAADAPSADAPAADAPAADVPAADAPAADDVAEDKLVFGYIAYNMADIWNEYSALAFEYAAEQVGAEVVILDAQNDVATYISCMESLIQQEVDGISIFPISGEQGAQCVEMANEAGIPITVENLDMREYAEDDKYISSIGSVYADVGYTAIEWLANNVENAKVFYAAGAVGGGVFEGYIVGVEQALKDYADKIEMVGLTNGDWSTEDGLNMTQNFINSGTEFNCIFANNDLMAQGCYQALQAAGMENEIPIISTGGSPDAYAFLESGVEAANVTAPVSVQGMISFLNIYNYVVDGTVPAEKFKSLTLIPISGDTLDQWLDWSDYPGAWEYIEENNLAS